MCKYVLSYVTLYYSIGLDPARTLMIGDRYVTISAAIDTLGMAFIHPSIHPSIHSFIHPFISIYIQVGYRYPFWTTEQTENCFSINRNKL